MSTTALLLLTSWLFLWPMQSMPVAPAGAWDGGTDSGRCFTARRYATGGGEAMIELSRAPLGSGTGLRLILPGTIDANPRVEALKLRFGPSGQPGTFGVDATKSDVAGTTSLSLQTGIAGDGRVVREVRLSPAMAEEIASADSLQIEAGGGHPITLAFAGGVSVLNALDACERRLAIEWGIDLAERERIASAAQPAPDVARWVTTDDYPPEALRVSAQGKTIVLFHVETDGKVKTCHTRISSGHRVLDEAACRAIIRRARYEPARDRKGIATREPIVRTIDWMLPTRARRVRAPKD